MSAQSPPKAITTGGEFPSKAQLAGLGDLTFLFLRAPQYQAFSVAQLRHSLQPAVDTGHFAIMRQHHVPRGALTFAMLDEAAEGKLLSGFLLNSQEWMSGDRLWLMDVVAPYGQGSPAQLIRFWHSRISDKVSAYSFQRAGRSSKRPRRYTARRLPNGRWGSRLWENGKRPNQKT